MEDVLGHEKNYTDGVRAEWAGSAPILHCRQNSVDREKEEQVEAINADTK